MMETANFLEMACGCKMNKTTFELIHNPQCIVEEYLKEKARKEAKNV